MIEQGSQEWFAARLGKVTGSKIKDVMAKGKGSSVSLTRTKYITQLALERMTGKTPETYKSKAMENGSLLEPDAVMVYEWQKDVETELVGFVDHPSIENFGASPDRLVGKDGLLEIKCVLPHTHIAWMRAGKVPAEHVKQMGAEIDVTGRKWCDFVSYCPDLPTELQLFVVRYERDNERISEMQEAVVKFLAEVDDEVKWLKERMTND